MNWNSTQQSRLSVEKDLLDSKLNGVTWLDPTVAGKTRVEWQTRTNNKQNFTLRVYLSDKFPNECPKLVVSSSPYGSPLKKMRNSGPLMNATSLNDHTHQAYDGCTQICHYIPSKWSNVNTLYQVLMKGRIWLEAYELRRISGGNLDQYLAHFEIDTKKPEKMNERELRGVVCLMQPNFIDILKRNKADGIVFSVTTFDGSDTIHVRVARTDKSVQKDISTSVTFKVFEGLPRNYANFHLIASGLISNLADLNQPKVAILVSEDDHIRAFVKLESDKPVEEAAVLSLPSRFHLFNNNGIIEPRLLADRKVAVVGLGSGGSHVAMELAKSGVGKFVLVDYDRIELQNVIRHVCGLRDLGRLKTNAMRDRILEKNPFAEIEICNIDVNNLERARQIFKGCDIIIAATDNITSRFNINTLSLELGIVTLYGACSIRASGGQVVRVRPNDGPCFSCIYVDAAMEAMQEELSSFAQAREAFPPYIGDDEVEANIQVGLSSDIVPIANMLVKVALLELCRGENTALTSLEEDLDGSFYMWANRREQEYSRYSEDSFHRSNEPAILRWYQLRSKRRPDCMICQNMEGSAKNREFFTSKGS